MLLGDELRVVGKGSLLQLRHHLHFVVLVDYAEEDAAAVRVDHHLNRRVLVGEQPAQLVQRPRRHDDLDLLRHGVLQAQVVHRQPEPIGRG